MNKQYLQDTDNNKKRQILFNEELQEAVLLQADASKSAGEPIRTLDELKEALQQAIELEHTTIPAYLSALYSIKDGTNPESIKNIRGVAVEEMLHMVLAANLLNAIGGAPVINKPGFIPKYPYKMELSDEPFEVNLDYFSPDSISVFMHIEKPQPTNKPPAPGVYHSIGQFYTAIYRAMHRLDKHTPGGIFVGDHSKQITSEHYYGSGGKLIGVYDMKSAHIAILEIIGQGEGVDGSIIDSDSVLFGEDVELAHYFRFSEIYYERHYREDDNSSQPPTGKPLPVNWSAVQKFKKNMKMNDYEQGSALWRAALDFNITYNQLLNNIHIACNGNPAHISKGIGLMYDLKYKAVALMNMPMGDGWYAAPTFEYVPLDQI